MKYRDVPSAPSYKYRGEVGNSQVGTLVCLF